MAISIQNSDYDGTVLVKKVDLPDGWILKYALPLRIDPAGTLTFYIEGPAGEDAGFDALPFAVHTDHPDYPLMKAAIQYQPIPPPPARLRAREKARGIVAAPPNG